MINFELQNDNGILLLDPQGRIEAADFTSITSLVDTYLAGHGTLPGILIHAKSFPGWQDFAGMLAHFKFLKAHIGRIKKVAVVADGVLATILPNIAQYFVHAQVRHFNYLREDAALDWLHHAGKARIAPRQETLA